MHLIARDLGRCDDDVDGGDDDGDEEHFLFLRGSENLG